MKQIQTQADAAPAIGQQFTIGVLDNKPALYSHRGLVAVFEAGYGQTREQDAKNIAQMLNSHDELVGALRECITNDGAHCLAYGADTPTLRARLSRISATARAALARAERGQA